MTAVPNCDIVGPTSTDAELARAAAAGDRNAFAGIYDRYADRLHDFCVGMLRDRDGAADCVQDVFCTAATRLPQLREPDKLRPWLYAIARNEGLRRIRERRRETPSDELPDAVSHEPGPDTLAARTELSDLIAEAAGGLSDRDRSVFELAYRHGLDGPDLADALGVSPTNANKMVYRLRETIERSLGALLVSRRVRNTGDGCPELAAILDGWDGQFSILMRKRIARHIESCPTCDEDRQRLVTPAALLGAVPVFIPAPAWLRDRTLSDIRLDCLATPITEDAVDPGAADAAGSTNSALSEKLAAAANPAPPIPIAHVDDAHGRRTRNVMLLVALIVATLMASLGLTLAWLFQQNTPITPTDVSGTAPKTVSTTPAAPTPSSPAPVPPTAGVATTVPLAPPPSVPPPPPPAALPSSPAPVVPRQNWPSQSAPTSVPRPEIGVTRTPVTRAPISVAPKPRAPAETASPGDNNPSPGDNNPRRGR